ncbi:MAG: hypothetical protein C5B49_06925 [Bdellovibrio sp.]|nr:MAG: hypothetical protein C5B49_06925 [Bdellovibrio sp.]
MASIQSLFLSTLVLAGGALAQQLRAPEEFRLLTYDSHGDPTDPALAKCKDKFNQKTMVTSTLRLGDGPPCSFSFFSDDGQAAISEHCLVECLKSGAGKSQRPIPGPLKEIALGTAKEPAVGYQVDPDKLDEVRCPIKRGGKDTDFEASIVFLGSLKFPEDRTIVGVEGLGQGFRGWGTGDDFAIVKIHRVLREHKTEPPVPFFSWPPHCAEISTETPDPAGELLSVSYPYLVVPREEASLSKRPFFTVGRMGKTADVPDDRKRDMASLGNNVFVSTLDGEPAASGAGVFDKNCKLIAMTSALLKTEKQLTYIKNTTVLIPMKYIMERVGPVREQQMRSGCSPVFQRAKVGESRTIDKGGEKSRFRR